MRMKLRACDDALALSRAFSSTLLLLMTVDADQFVRWEDDLIVSVMSQGGFDPVSPCSVR